MIQNLKKKKKMLWIVAMKINILWEYNFKKYCTISDWIALEKISRIIIVVPQVYPWLNLKNDVIFLQDFLSQTWYPRWCSRLILPILPTYQPFIVLNNRETHTKTPHEYQRNYLKRISRDAHQVSTHTVFAISCVSFSSS